MQEVVCQRIVDITAVELKGSKAQTSDKGNAEVQTTEQLLLFLWCPCRSGIPAMLGFVRVGWFVPSLCQYTNLTSTYLACSSVRDSEGVTATEICFSSSEDTESVRAGGRVGTVDMLRAFASDENSDS